jgi:predicted alpha/beta superfamily hydrolase
MRRTWLPFVIIRHSDCITFSRAFIPALSLSLCFDTADFLATSSRGSRVSSHDSATLVDIYRASLDLQQNDCRPFGTNINVMKNLVRIIAVFLMAVSTVSLAMDTRFLQGLGHAHYTRIESGTLARHFHLFVMLPDGYEQSPEKDYPTIYLLDGGALFPLLSAYYRYLNFGEEIPDAIVVGISYGSDSFEEGNYRSTDYTAESLERDYWGGAGRFQSFLSGELLPFIERTYRSDADRRVIFGQSLGGQFVLYTALTRPDLFWGHIASNPALHRNLPFFLRRYGKAEVTGEQPRLFVASGSEDDPRFRVPTLEWIEHWSSNDDNPWQLKTMSLDGHTHMSAPPASFRQGMAWLFSE